MPNARRFSPTVNTDVASAASGPLPPISLASSWSVLPAAAGKSASRGSCAAATLARSPPASGTCSIGSPPPESPPQPAAKASAAAIAIIMSPRCTGLMSLEGHHHHHHHGVAPDADRRRLAAALALILAFMVAEVVAGLLASSLALLSDAAHMLTDAGAIALALVAARLAARPAGGGYTFGLKRAEILSAQLNGATLLALAAVILLEGIRRLVDPPDVEGAIVLVVAIAGIVVNLAATAVLAGDH